VLCTSREQKKTEVPEMFLNYLAHQILVLKKALTPGHREGTAIFIGCCVFEITVFNRNLLRERLYKLRNEK